MKTFLKSACAVLTSSVAANAANLSIDFENAPYTPAISQDLDGLDGWVTTAGETAGTAFTLTNGTNAGAIGGFIVSPAATGASTVAVTHLYSASNLGNTSFAFDGSIIDSSDAQPNRDSYAFSINGTSGNLFSILFVPAAQTATPDADSNALWDLSYMGGGGPTVALGQAVIESGFYNFSVGFTPNGASTDFALTLTSLGIFSTSGTVAVDPTADVTGIGYSWTPLDQANPGDGAITFDNITAVPEPSALLLSGIAGLALVLRRKRY